MYNKLYTKILDSSIWLEDSHVRLVWLTFLAVMDQEGTVALSGIGNVANRARVTEQEAEEAIHVLESPDNRNPGQDRDGRRIERIPGVGWIVLNAKKYRDLIRADEIRAATRDRVRRHREKHSNAHGNANVTSAGAGAGAGAGAEQGRASPTPPPDIMDGMDKDEIELPIAKPMPPIPVKVGLPDFLAMHGAIFIGREEREDWAAILRHWGWEACEDAARTLAKQAKGGKRIYRSEFTAWLDANYTVTKDDT